MKLQNKINLIKYKTFETNKSSFIFPLYKII